MKLYGHSGCILSLNEQNGRYYIEKKSERYEYNERLRKQCIKQSQYKSDIFHSIDVLSWGYDQNGFFFFDMEYIPGITLAEYIRDISLCEIEDLANKLFGNISNFGPYDGEAKSIFAKKISSVSESIKKIGVDVKWIEDFLLQYEWPYMVRSSCHGDFTLENMIVYQGEIYLLDFLDSFYDSWIIDFAKVLQDIDIFWHYRKETYINNNLYLRLLILKESLIEKILLLPNGKELIESIYYTFLLNVLRIFPYTTDRYTLDFLQQKARYIYKKIYDENWR